MTSTTEALKITPKIYESNIPKCCSLKTIEEHESIMLCWGLMASLRDEYEMNCGDCDMRIKND